MQIVQSAVVALDIMNVLLCTSMVSQEADTLGQRVIIRYNGSSITVRAKILARIEAETRKVTVAAHTLPSRARTMSLGCIPVVSDAGALPEVVGGAGIVVPVNDVEAAVESIRQALESDHGDDARERVVKMFSADRREGDLERVIVALAG